MLVKSEQEVGILNVEMLLVTYKQVVVMLTVGRLVEVFRQVRETYRQKTLAVL